MRKLASARESKSQGRDNATSETISPRFNGTRSRHMTHFRRSSGRLFVATLVSGGSLRRRSRTLELVGSAVESLPAWMFPEWSENRTAQSAVSDPQLHAFLTLVELLTRP